MTYREHHGVDKHNGKEEVDEMDNQVAWREGKRPEVDLPLSSAAAYISHFTGLFHFFFSLIKLQIRPCVTPKAI